MRESLGAQLVWVRRSVALILLAACSGKSLTPDAAVEAGAPDGSAEAAADTIAETGTPDLAADRAEAGRCTHTEDRATVLVLAPGGELLSCDTNPGDAGAAPPRTWVGKVTASDETTLVVDVCAGDGGCDPVGLRIEARAPGLDLRGFPHVWVQVTASFYRFYACQQSLAITTATPLDGSAAPGPVDQLLLVVADGAGTGAGALYSVDRVRLGCSSEKGCGSIAPDDYALEFTTPASTTPLRVYMGETATLTVGTTPLRVRNLRSYQSTVCDDYWNWAYTIYLDPK